MTPSVELKYPVLMVGEGYFMVCRTAKRFEECSMKALRGRVFENAFYIDSIGRKFSLAQLKFINYTQPFWGFRLLESRRITVSMFFNFECELSMEQVINIVKERLDSSVWGASEDYFPEIVTRSTSLRDFFELLDA